MRTVRSVVEPCGPTFSAPKTRIGQALVYLGILVDTRSMTLRFDALTAKVMRLELEAALRNVLEGRTPQPKEVMRSTGGRLSWYSSVLQSGRARSRAWWLSLKHGLKLAPYWRSQLTEDLVWWVAVLSSWEDGGDAAATYPILSADEILNTPGRLHLLQSDASGPDGFGYFHGVPGDLNPRLYSRTWGDGYEFVTSHNGELSAPLCFVRREDVSNCVLVWTTDCQAAVWSVCKGRCREDAGMAQLRELLQLCDERRVTLMAVWMPREEMQRADLLSHLATRLGVPETWGRSTDL